MCVLKFLVYEFYHGLFIFFSITHSIIFQFKKFRIMIDMRREDKLNIETLRKSIQYLAMLAHIIQESFCYSMIQCK